MKQLRYGSGLSDLIMFVLLMASVVAICLGIAIWDWRTATDPSLFYTAVVVLAIGLYVRVFCR